MLLKRVEIYNVPSFASRIWTWQQSKTWSLTWSLAAPGPALHAALALCSSCALFKISLSHHSQPPPSRWLYHVTSSYRKDQLAECSQRWRRWSVKLVNLALTKRQNYRNNFPQWVLYHQKCFFYMQSFRIVLVRPARRLRSQECRRLLQRTWLVRVKHKQFEWLFSFTFFSVYFLVAANFF